MNAIRIAGGRPVPDNLNAFLHIDNRQPEEDTAGAPCPLAGVLIGVKDNIQVKGMPMTCASRMLADYVSPYDATVVTRLRNAGAWIAGKTNMDEFGFGSSGEYSAFGPTRHPQDPERVPGGSSSGSAAAVAAGLVDAALGSDTGGSVRQPAAFCGIVGLRPTWGAVSRYGLTAFASSLDQIGVLAPDVARTRQVFDAIAGPDPLDATSCPFPEGKPVLRTGSSERPVIGWDPAVLEVCDGDVRDVVRGMMDRLRQSGYAVREIPSVDPEDMLSLYHVIASAEAASNLSRFDGLRYGLHGPDVVRSRSAGFGVEVKRRILTGTWCLAAGEGEAYYRQAREVRRRLVHHVNQFWKQADVMLSPTTPTVAFPLGSRRRPLDMYRSDQLTVMASLAGLPALSIPAGSGSEGLPVGVQLTGPAFSEYRLLDFGAELESLNLTEGWHG